MEDSAQEELTYYGYARLHTSLDLSVSVQMYITCAMKTKVEAGNEDRCAAEEGVTHARALVTCMRVKRRAKRIALTLHPYPFIDSFLIRPLLMSCFDRE